MTTQTDLAKAYDPTQVEDEMAAVWDAAGAFHAEPADAQGGAEPYCIVIPPPNVTAALHMGHALNNTLQDILIRYHRMLGRNTLWMPGTDHAGIATQTVVDKRLQAEHQPALKHYKQLESEGKDGRDRFIEKVQAWKDDYEAQITNQLKAMGCSCDWDRQRFTMDDVCARAVREAFFRLFKDGLIYRGKRLVNWDPATQTALADDEVEMRDIDGFFWYLRYPLDDGSGHVTVATTRPETMLGDTAVAMNPNDPRAAELRGKKVRLPIINRIVPIIEDDYVVLPDPQGDEKARYSSGFLKVTPAHDPNDYEIGQRFDLDMINVMAPDGSISDEHGWPDDDFAQSDAGFVLGMDRYEAREVIVDWFRENNLLEDVKPYRHAVGHSYRSHVSIEPYLSDQWYVKVTDDRLAGATLRALSSGTGVPPVNCVPSGTGVPPVNIPPITARLHVHRRHLPHWQSGGSTYFVTFRLAEGQLTEPERRIVRDACLHWHGQKMDVHLITVMPDHVHLLIEPLAIEQGQWHSLPEIMHSIKSFAAHQINNLRGRSGSLWQGEYFDRIVRDEQEFELKWNYMHLNPVKAGIVDQPEDYPFTVSGFWAQGDDDDDDGRDARPTKDAHPTDSDVNSSRTGVSPVNCVPPVKTGDWQGKLRFIPPRYANTFRGWNENIRDWCISRQLWWGHRIPVWSIEGKPSKLDPLVREGRIAIQQSDEFCYVCVRDESDKELTHALDELGFVRDPDVLDTWFSSGLWPISTLGWPDEEGNEALQTWNPSNVLCTAREIITLWVSRMVMFNIYLRGCLPFTDVFIHAMIQDGQGRKMSKSLGNGVDPLDIIHTHGADAMRFTLTSMTTQTQDVRLPVEKDPKSGRNTSSKFDIGRNFANKLWNAARFAMGNLTGDDAAQEDRDLADRWILSRLAATVRDTNAALAGYEFSQYAQGLYDFFWRDFCDWYIEAVKPTVRDNPSQQRVLAACLDVALRLLHPAMPFVTEKLWQRLNELAPQRGLKGVDIPTGELLVRAAWPKVDESLIDPAVELQFGAIQAWSAAIREIRQSHQIPPREAIQFTSEPGDDSLQQHARYFEIFANASLTDDATATRIATAQVDARTLVVFGQVGDADHQAERDRLTRRLDEVRKSVATLQGRLNNTGYTDKAPAHLVQQTRDQLAAAGQEADALESQIAALE